MVFILPCEITCIDEACEMEISLPGFLLGYGRGY
jgi:hypothetical protein